MKKLRTLQFGSMLLLVCSLIFLLNRKKGSLKCEIPHNIEYVDTVTTITKSDPLFTYDYANGDTSCFELVEDTTTESGVDIRIRCVCSCDEYKKKKL